MRNNDVIERFMRGYDAQNHSKNLVSFGSTLFNYNTKIAQHFGAITLVNGSKYSSTTSKHQNYIKNYGGLTIVLNKDDFFYITDMDYSEAYDLAYEIKNTLMNEGEFQVDFTLPQKKYDSLREELQKLLYINKK